MILTLLTFGDNLDNHYQANFAILSYLKDPKITHVCVVTDRPQYYQGFDEKLVLIEIDEAKMQSWRGHEDFFWRIKMKAIEAAALRFPSEHLLYVDSDTFLVTDLERLQSGLDQGQCFMHIEEGKLSQLDSKTERRMWNSLKEKTFASHHIDANTAMWNAGVIAISAHQSVNIIQNAIQACDEMCQTDCTRRLIEQFAFSLALNHDGNLQPADREIAHYWGNKGEWNNAIREFFVYSHLTQASLTEQINQIRQFDARQLPILKKEKRIKGQLLKWIEKRIPSKKVVYFS